MTAPESATVAFTDVYSIKSDNFCGLRYFKHINTIALRKTEIVFVRYFVESF